MTTKNPGLDPVSISPAESEALAKLAGFGLLDAINGRRSRRFPVGGEVPAGPLAWKSKKPVQPLSDLERAIVLATVTGTTGWHHGITHHPGYAPSLPDYPGSATGRTFPSAAGFEIVDFFFTDESGTYFLSTRDAVPEVPFTEGEGFTEQRLNAVLGRAQRISDERIFIPREEPYLEGHNTWIANHPGSLLVIPVADLAQHTLANLAFFTRNRYVIFDDINNRPIPGIEKFGDIARVDDPLPLSFLEQYSITEASAELMSATLVGHLVLGAMGLGGWSFDGIDRLTMLGASGRDDVPGLGFRYDEDERWALPNATGLPGVYETYSRPHYDSMDDAIDAFHERKYGPGGPSHPDTPGPWTESRAIRSRAAKPDARYVELMKLQARYIDETFGKFPGTVPTVWIMNYLQAQHLDTDYYDAIFDKGAYLSTHRDHQSLWHR